MHNNENGILFIAVFVFIFFAAKYTSVWILKLSTIGSAMKIDALTN